MRGKEQGNSRYKIHSFFSVMVRRIFGFVRAWGLQHQVKTIISLVHISECFPLLLTFFFPPYLFYLFHPCLLSGYKTNFKSSVAILFQGVTFVILLSVYSVEEFNIILCWQVAVKKQRFLDISLHVYLFSLMIAVFCHWNSFN